MNNDFHDVDYTEVNNNINENNSEKIINGRILYYSTSQVASILNIPDSKVRYYTSSFDDILKIEVSNKQRRYKESDIDKLKFILSLKEEGMTIKQIQDYCTEVDFDNSKDIQIKESNPLAIKTLARAITEVLLEEQDKKLNQLKEDIVNELISNNNNLNEQIAITVDEIVESKLNQNKDNIVEDISQNINQLIDKQEKAFMDKDNERIKMIREHQAELKKQYDLLQQSKNKGFFRWFKRG